MKLHEVIPNLAIRGWPGMRHLQAIREGGWVVVCVCPQHDRELSIALGDRRYQHHPLSDGRLDNKNRVTAEAAGRQVAYLLRTGRRVIVHCHAGRNRSALVAALAYIELTGCSGAEAVAHLRAVRPRALANPHFEEYLLSFRAASDVFGLPAPSPTPSVPV